MQNAANYASAVMRTGKGVAPATTVTAASDPSAPHQRTEAEIRLTDLLQQQMSLASDPSREAEYMALVKEIAAVSAEVDATRTNGAAA
jgi:hypothetical protein